MKTLLVAKDDNRRAALYAQLTACDCFVTACRDEAAAQKDSGGKTSALVLLDSVGGYEESLALCRALRTWPGGSLCVVLFLVDECTEPIVSEAIAAGVDDLWVGPLDEASIRARVALAQARFRERIHLARVEGALARAEGRYQRLAEAVTDYLFTVSVVDNQAVRTVHNPACEAVTGYSREEFENNPYLWIEMVLDADRERVTEQANRVLAGGVMESLEHRIIRKDGEMRWVCNILVPHHDEAGTLTSYDGLVRDVTERRTFEEQQKMLEAQVLRSQRLESLGALAGGVAHDFNNILGAILGYATLAREDLPLDSTAREELDQVLQAAERARELVLQILAFSREDEKARAPIAFSKIVLEAMRLLRPCLPTTIEFRHSLTDEPNTVLADATQLHRAVVNLCTNAAHAMRSKGGVLALNLDIASLPEDANPRYGELPPGDYVRLAVTDTGEGIPADKIDSIFEPFFTTKSVNEGTGMGLALVQSTVAGHDGAVAVASELGMGSTFEILIPRAAEGAAVGETVEEEGVPAGKERVLLVDDEEVLALLGQQTLERHGYSVTAFTDSTEALERFREAPHSFDVIVTDQTMPGLTGDALARSITSIRPNIPVILTTGYAEALNPETVREAGILEIIVKPVKSTALAKTIRRLLDAS